jgi:hypothetical protein
MNGLTLVYIYIGIDFVFTPSQQRSWSGAPFLGISSSYANMRLHTKNQLPRLPVSAFKSPGGGRGVVGGFLPIIKSLLSHVDVESGL